LALGCLVAALSASTALAAEYHVAADGTAEASGSVDDPWDLATALAHPEQVLPGDTIWLHGGAYYGSFSSDLTGADGSPITVRGYEGEWATIDGLGSDETTLSIEGAFTHYRDFEVTNGEPDRWGGRPAGFYVVGPEVKLINLVIHDTGNNGFWTGAENLEIYGCLIYHVGFDDEDRGHGHSIYTQNEIGTKVIEDNIIFGGYSFGIHAYTEGGSIQGFDIIGNTWWNAGVISSVSGHKDDCLVGGQQPAARILLEENMSWAPTPTTRTVRLGWGVANEDVDLLDNYFVGEVNFAQPWTSITIEGNTFYSSVVGVDTAEFPDNEYLTEQPQAARVFVRPNRYEVGRAQITVYNWGLAATVPVDPSAVLEIGEHFELIDAQSYFAPSVLTGSYQGQPLDLPMDLPDPVQPVGEPGVLEEEDFSGPGFQVFVLRRTDGGPDDPPHDAGPDDAGPDVDGSADGSGAGAGGCSCRVSGSRADRGLLALIAISFGWSE
jgi:hypothetical protein